MIPLLHRRLKEMEKEGRLPVWLTPAAVDEAREQIEYHKKVQEYKAKRTVVFKAGVQRAIAGASSQMVGGALDPIC